MHLSVQVVFFVLVMLLTDEHNVEHGGFDMAISYTKKTFTDTASSGTAITASDMNKYESILKALVDFVNAHDDTGWKVIWNSKETGTFVKVRRIGKACYMQWYFKACSGTRWVLPADVPTDMRPQASFTAAGAHSFGASNNTSTVYIFYYGQVDFMDYLPSGSYSEGCVSWLAG